ncbi:hypothetical protein GCM10009127_14820 [Alteraurantiacibacter aestuarii]|uniref:MoaD/ThiS family protein n=1 Tax=Alteraurantiacibacter aestuarii TaxID=650004 RepID=A0A844ZHG6_9SPHN|nr:MoaD/ThiS family protein [Alteraurantiacibacter aestuarii]MXO87931.1 MoaD/ThiS family protein [Alteraurantiacibacter aestuarii]
MAVTLVFLGKLADLAGVSDKQLEGPLDWQGLCDELQGPLADAVKQDRTRIAVNGQVLADKTSLSAVDGDEVALLPPVSGG